MRPIAAKRRRWDPWGLVVGWLCLLPSSYGATFYVSLASPNPAPPYESWASAAQVIQEALDLARPGDTVVVTNGVYARGRGTESSRVSIPSAVVLRSVNGPAYTSIHGGIESGEPVRAASLATNAVLEGFRLSGGVARDAGGGVRSVGGVVSNCVITANSAPVGGGGFGGMFRHCLIADNSAESGGGIAQAELWNCRVFTNKAAHAGGGLAHATARNSFILGNRSATAARDSANTGGGAFASKIYNCTVIYNHSEGVTGGGGTGQCEVYNSILWFNSVRAGDYPANSGGDTWMEHSCTSPLPPQFAGRGNISADPRVGYDGHLSPGPSPCRAAGSSAYASGTDLDGDPWKTPPSIGADESQAESLQPIDIELQVHTPVPGRIPLDSPVYVSANSLGPASVLVIDFGDGTSVTNSMATNHIALSVPHRWSSALGEVRITATAYAPGNIPPSASASVLATVVDSFGFYEPERHHLESTPVIQVPVVRRGLKEEAAAVHYAVVRGTAAEWVDFVPQTGTLLFAPGETFQSIPVELRDDAAPELPEYFIVILDDAVGGAVVARPTTQTNYIHDVPFYFAADALATAPPRPPGTLVTNFLETVDAMRVFIRPIPGLPIANIAVTTMDETARAGEDYRAVAATVRPQFDPPNLMITIPLLNDTVKEAAMESLALVARAADSVQADEELRLRLNILDNDTGFRFASAFVVVNEAEGFATLAVERGSDPGSEASVDFLIRSETAEPGADYLQQQGRLIFGADEMVKSIRIELVDDASEEADETFLVELLNPSSGQALGTPAQTKLTIRSDDARVFFVQQESRASEQSGATATIEIARSGGFDREASVEFSTADASALAGQDYVARSGVAVFHKEMRSTFVAIPLLDDETAEANEHFLLRLLNPSRGMILGQPAQHSILVADDDLRIELGFAQPTYAVNELDGIASIKLTRAPPLTGSASVTVLLAPRSATHRLDYEGVEFFASWGENQPDAFIQIPVIEDTLIEGDETVSLWLTNPGSSTGLPVRITGSPTATLVIQDAGAAVEFDRAQILSATESNTVAAVVVRRRGPIDPPFSVGYSVIPIEAQRAVDFIAEPGVLSFAAGQLTHAIHIQLLDDSVVDGSKRLRLVLGPPDSGVSLTSNSNVVFTILDDERPTLLDPTFRPPLAAARSTIVGAGLQPDGKLVLAGALRLEGGDPGVQRMLRLNSDGSVEPTFRPPQDPVFFPPDDFWSPVFVQADGKILFVVRFQLPDSQALGLRRLTADGAADATFVQTNLFTRAPEFGWTWLHAFAETPDGMFLVGGEFGSVNGVPRRGLARFHKDGTLDPAFDPGAGALYTDPNSPGLKRSGIQGIAVQQDGRVLIGGSFVEVQGARRIGIARLNGDGSLDTTFIAPDFLRHTHESAQAAVTVLELLPDGQVLVGGSFRTPDGSGLLARLNRDGTVDPTFQFRADGNHIGSLKNQPDGRIWIGGDFSRIHGVPRRVLARLLPDGALDAGFEAAQLGSLGRLLSQSDGALIVSGSVFDEGGEPSQGLFRIRPDNGRTPSIQFARRRAEVREDGTNAFVTLRRTGDATAPASVMLSAWSGSATRGEDFASTAVTVTLAAGENARQFAIPILDDGRVEIDETFEAALEAAPGGVAVGWLDRARIRVRDNEVGTGLDRRFQPLVQGSIQSVGVQNDARVLIASLLYNETNEVQQTQLRRYRMDGTVDEGFYAEFEADGCCPSVMRILSQPDGRVLVHGYFQVVNGVRRFGLARLQPNGAIDPTFDADQALAENWVSTMEAQADGKLWVATQDARLMRLDTNGVMETGFEPSQPDGRINRIQPLADGRTLVLGWFGSMAGTETPWGVARLHADGAIDRSFKLPAEIPGSTSYIVGWLGALSDGSVLLRAAAWDESAQTELLDLIKVAPDGAIDAGFRPDPDSIASNPNAIGTMIPEADGHWLWAEREFAPGQGETGFYRLRRFDGHGAPDPQFGTFRFINRAGIKRGSEVRIEMSTDRQFAALGPLDLAPEHAHDFPVLMVRPKNPPRTAVHLRPGSLAMSENQEAARFTVVREGDTAEEQSVAVILTEISARSGIDFLPPPTSITFRPLQGEAILSIPLLDNSTLSGDRTVVLELADPPSGLALEGSRSFLIVKDDDRDGSVDTSFRFDAPLLPDWGEAFVQRIHLQPKDKIQAYGHFPVEERRECTGFIQLVAAGAIDPALDRFTCPQRIIATLAGGRWLSDRDGWVTRHVPDGQVDETFARLVQAGGVLAAAEQADGSILVGGSFGAVPNATVPTARLARLTPNGFIDHTFIPRILGSAAYRIDEGTVSSIAVLEDGRILIGGGFRIEGRTDFVQLARLEADGRRDPSFPLWTTASDAPAPGFVNRFAVVPNGHLLILGQHSSIGFNGQQRIAELDANGTLLRVLDWGAGPLSRRDNATLEPGWLSEMLLLPDGDLLVGGGFSQFDGVRANGMIRLNLNTVPGPRIESILVHATGIRLTAAVLAGARYSLEHSRDLIHWTTLSSQTAASPSIEFTDPMDPAPGARAYYRIRRE